MPSRKDIPLRKAIQAITTGRTTGNRATISFRTTMKLTPVTSISGAAVEDIEKLLSQILFI